MPALVAVEVFHGDDQATTAAPLHALPGRGVERIELALLPVLSVEAPLWRWIIVAEAPQRIYHQVEPVGAADPVLPPPHGEHVEAQLIGQGRQGPPILPQLGDPFLHFVHSDLLSIEEILPRSDRPTRGLLPAAARSPACKRTRRRPPGTDRAGTAHRRDSWGVAAGLTPRPRCTTVSAGASDRPARSQTATARG